jgi:hypothetical protein
MEMGLVTFSRSFNSTILSEPCSVGTVNWQFRTADARIKLKWFYPVQQPDSQPPEHVV